MKIYTITLNPAFDLHASAKKLEIGHENLAEMTSRDAGGKGINISRALCANGVENTAIVVLGQENGADFRALLDEYGVNYIAVEKQGRIRENLTMHTDGGETRISFSGFSLDSSVLREIKSLIDCDKYTVVTFTGSVPCGISISDCKKFLIELRACGAKVVVDSKSFSPDDLIEVKPWLIKPNGEEISAYLKRDIADFSDCADAACALCDKGIENVMVSLGERGAMLINSNFSAVAEPPTISAISTVGAGDSTLAGFISAYIEGADDGEMLSRAVAFGSAACLLDGTAPPHSSSVAELSEKIKITSL